MEFGGVKREIDRKCLNHARVHANAQSFDRCESAFMNLTFRMLQHTSSEVTVIKTTMMTMKRQMKINRPS